MSKALSAIIPVYEEPVWIRTSLADLDAEIMSSPFADDAEIIVVDDGSGPETAEAILDTVTQTPVRIVRLDKNSGRLIARREGIQVAEGDLVLFIDSRISMGPGGLSFIAEAVRDPETRVWNAHVDMDDDVNPYSRFWSLIVGEVWKGIDDNGGRHRWGADEFDTRPRGTTCFVAPREDAAAAMEGVTSLVADARRANDEVILRRLIEVHDFNMDPAFRCEYRGRKSLKGFMRHAHHRGIVFVDGFLHPGRRFFPVLVAFFPASIATVALTLRWPRRALKIALVVPMLVAGLVGLRHRNARDATVAGTLVLPWLVSFATGVWRGLLMVAAARRGGSRS